MRCFSPLPRKQQIINEKPTLFNKVTLLYGQTEFAGSHFYHGTANSDNNKGLTPGLSYLLEHIFRTSAYPLVDLLKYVYTESDGKAENGGDDNVKNRVS